MNSCRGHYTSRPTPIRRDCPIYSVAAGRAARAILLAGAASALRQAIGVPLSAMARDDLERMLAPARKLLGEEVAKSIWSEGRGLKIEQIVAEAEKEYNQSGSESNH